ncbi:glutamate 5-kinase [Breoghania sp.]|uniref:glutamate 5-kinase n=1 Tax=Breoghania sp. TaxID=2065378 RepID=UPI00260CB4E6|nr:glutamate 5-kinase [Breoghania sp.]MDJ0933306.1 glutamate 5-kinase [Breoghania sp.]
MLNLEDHSRIVVKIGSALLVEEGHLKRDWLNFLADDLCRLTKRGTEVIVVSSGAIALGRGVLGLPKGVLKLEESQGAAAVGQIELAEAYQKIFAHRGMTTGQVLLTLRDTEQRRRYLNARATVSTLLKLGAVPVINENDTVATTEIRYGDNDRLAARVATMVSADCLVLLSDIDGLYTAPPAENPLAEHIPVVERITREIESMAGAVGSELSRGGMKTKIEAGKIATNAGTAMVIASGKRLHPLTNIAQGGRCTWFKAHSTSATARKTWIAGQLKPTGQVTIDAGAEKALRKGKSLLPAGVTDVSGRFQRGDTVCIVDASGREIGRGLVAYDCDDAVRLVGHRSREIESILGYSSRAEMIHRDDMVLGDDD